MKSNSIYVVGMILALALPKAWAEETITQNNGAATDPEVKVSDTVTADPLPDVTIDGKTACGTLAAACEQNGYVAGGWKQKKGLGRDCMRPALYGAKAMALAPGSKASVITTVSAEIIAKCKAEPHPCMEVINACEDAGFVTKGAKNKKDIQKDCMRPLVNLKKSVKGVTISDTVVNACAEVRSARRAANGKDGEEDDAKDKGQKKHGKLVPDSDSKKKRQKSGATSAQ